MTNILGNILGYTVALSVVFGILCTATGDESKGNTVIINSITSTILYAVILCVFSFDGSKNAMIRSAVPMIDGLGKYGNVITFLKQAPSDFALGFVQLVTLVLIITYISNLIDFRSAGFWGKLTSRLIIVLSGMIVYGVVMNRIEDNVIIRYFIYCVESFITVGAVTYTPVMLIANIIGVKKENWMLVYIVNQLPKSKIGKAISTAITTSVTLLCFLAVFETQYSTTENILSGGLAFIKSVGGVIVLCMGLYFAVKSVLKVK